MQTNLNSTEATNLKFDGYNRRIMVMLNFSVLLAESSLYTQSGFPSYYVKPVLVLAFLSSALYFLYLVIRHQDYIQHLTEWFRIYSKKPFCRIMGIVCIISLALRAFLHGETVYFIQIAFYAAAWLFLLVGIIRLATSRQL